MWYHGGTVKQDEECVKQENNLRTIKSPMYAFGLDNSLCQNSLYGSKFEVNGPPQYLPRSYIHAYNP